MRWGVFALLALGSARASAEPVEWSAFFGVDKLPKDVALGGSVDPEQRPQTGPMLGGRVTWLPLTSRWISAGLDGELSLTTSWTGYGFTSRRQSYFAPVLGYRAAVIVRAFPLRPIQPHLLGGGGGASTASYSPYMSTDTTGVLFWGAGVTVPVGGWNLRLDGHQVWIPVTSGDRAATYEVQLGIGGAIGGVKRTMPMPTHEDPAPPPPPVAPPLVLAPVPPAPPPPDPDGDGIAGADDHCPEQADDKDGFEDADGCPELDNDGDGIPDAADKCPSEPETRNSFDDGDGCPDELPPAIAAAFESATAVRFEPAKARITKAGTLALARTLKALRDNPMLKITVTGHDKDGELAKKRADAVKWYLVDKGIAQDQIDTTSAGAAKVVISISARP